MKKEFIFGSRVIYYTFERKNVKNINLRVRTDGSVYVSAPKFINENKVHEFVVSKADFIIKAIDKMSLNEHKKQKFEGYFDGDTAYILGREYSVRVCRSDKNRLCVDGDEITFFVTDTENVKLRTLLFDKMMLDVAQKTVTEICNRVYPLFSKKVKSFPELKFRKMKTKWGICRPQKSILTFNTLLALADCECIEYVVVHEFCHFLHPDHSKQFYNTLDGYFPHRKSCKDRLKKYNYYLAY